MLPDSKILSAENPFWLLISGLEVEIPIYNISHLRLKNGVRPRILLLSNPLIGLKRASLGVIHTIEDTHSHKSF